ncbi:hypothetical protein HMPREF9136_0247 [Prevotella dentalis DSM 3688]|uniref:Uncharacterized protein n=1 Tax=Prevotella dentalis (strain ATCC 49559 / DSM 3688 / JCM 13448 / NCTC 12043 / ES 2772) TaxID=908937 RepID=F9D070_PREDD|nr:hypothetical protein HMPREF9136_0247 [Prevotella dentalis DSM 3688]
MCTRKWRGEARWIQKTTTYRMGSKDNGISHGFKRQRHVA